MIKSIIKRDGRKVPFNLQKIADAIFKAAASVGGSDHDTALELAVEACEYLENLGNNTPTVEEIQNAVEKTLIEKGHAQTAKNYILYRANRTRAREMKTSLMEIYKDLTFKDAKDNDIKRENANIDGDTAMGTMLKYGSEGAKQFNKLFVLRPEHAKAHEEGDIHIHDLDFLTLTETCCQIDLIKLFKGGFCTGHGFLREPNDIASYSALAAIAIQSNQNDQHGGQSIPNFEYAMAIGVAKSYKKIYKKNLIKALDIYEIENAEEVANNITETLSKQDLVPALEKDEYVIAEAKELAKIGINDALIKKIQRFTKKYSEQEIDRATYQSMEAFVHNLNTMHSRAGAQIPDLLSKIFCLQQMQDLEMAKQQSSLSIFSRLKRALTTTNKILTMICLNLQSKFLQSVCSLTSHLLMRHSTFNTTKKAITEQKLHIWVAVQELQEMFMTKTGRLLLKEVTCHLHQSTCQDLEFWQTRI